jgi:hypothetical protein
MITAHHWSQYEILRDIYISTLINTEEFYFTLFWNQINDPNVPGGQSNAFPHFSYHANPGWEAFSFEPKYFYSSKPNLMYTYQKSLMVQMVLKD